MQLYINHSVGFLQRSYYEREGYTERKVVAPCLNCAWRLDSGGRLIPSLQLVVMALIIIRLNVNGILMLRM